MKSNAELNKIRSEGRFAHLQGKHTNPYQQGTLERLCWWAGYRSDIRSEDELRRAWAKQQPRQE